MFKNVIPSEANHRGAMVCGVEEFLVLQRA